MQKTHLRLQFHRQNKMYDFISFTNTRSRASHSQIFEFLNNKIVKNIFKKTFENVTFFGCVLLFHWKEIENENTTNVTV